MWTALLYVNLLSYVQQLNLTLIWLGFLGVHFELKGWAGGKIIPRV